mgnify:FL=1
MDIFNIISMVGGLALFLYGMTMLGSGLEKVAGGKLEQIMQKLTSNIFKSVLLGAVVTAMIQSSSATTVIVVGLVNAGVLKLGSAVGVIMGANIGTTVTGQILRLGDIGESGEVNLFLKILKPTTLAPIVAIIGILIFMLAKRSRTKSIGEILLGFGILFNGMFAMEAAVRPLSELPKFQELFLALSNPVLGVAVGAIVTMIIQSSSASVGILQALAKTGAVRYSAAIPIIMGQNIGTCITAILASIGANKNGKRAAIIHLYYNVIGTILFLIGIYSYQHFVGFGFWDRSINMGGIANFHTIFNIITTLALMGFAGWLEKLAKWTIRDDNGHEEVPEGAVLNLLDERLLSSPSVAIQHSRSTIEQMAKYAQRNFNESVKLFKKYDIKAVARIKEYEDMIDRMEDRLNSYLVQLTGRELPNDESANITFLLHLVSEYERVGDYAMNLTEQANMLFEEQASFSEQAQAEFDVITDAVAEIIELSIQSFVRNDLDIARSVEPLEEVIDTLEDKLKSMHIERFKTGGCNVDSSVIFLEALTNLERIADHCSNIAVYIIARNTGRDFINRHEYIEEMHRGKNIDYKSASEKFKSKYQLN